MDKVYGSFTELAAELGHGFSHGVPITVDGQTVVACSRCHRVKEEGVFKMSQYEVEAAKTNRKIGPRKYRDRYTVCRSCRELTRLRAHQYRRRVKKPMDPEILETECPTCLQQRALSSFGITETDRRYIKDHPMGVPKSGGPLGDGYYSNCLECRKDRRKASESWRSRQASYKKRPVSYTHLTLPTIYSV